MKFTEEQYQEIIRTYENNSGYDNKVMAVIRVVDDFNDSLSYNEAFALANPVTREWAHERFVEKEKEYYWKLNGLYLRKDYSDDSIIFDSHMYKYSFTETEIRKWGYNPEMFDKEEVK